MALTYRVRIHTVDDDRTVVYVNGTRYTEPHHWADHVKAVARRAVTHLFDVDGMTLSVESDRHHLLRGGEVAALIVTAA
jgi:hypothetical protein